MTFEILNTAAAVGTFVVITVTAIAALIQLRHLRDSNRLQSLIEVAAQIRELGPQLGFIYHDLPKKMESPEFRSEIGYVIDPKSHPELLVAIAMDQFGSLIRQGMLDETVIMEFAGGAPALLRTWDNLRGVIAIRRGVMPNAYQNFEYLAARAKRYVERFPKGKYPPSEPRLPLN